MDYLVITLIIFGHISGSESSLCYRSQNPVIQVCKDGTVSGTSVYMENREAPTEAVNCTCDVDVRGGTIYIIVYSGPDNSSCGIEFILGESNATLSCFSDNLYSQQSFSAIYFSKMSLTSGYGCLFIGGLPNRRIAGSSTRNVTITCHEPHVTTSMAPFITSTSVSDTKSTTTTSTTSMTRSECGSIAVVPGIIVGEAVLILLVQAVVWFLCCKRKDACSCLRKCLNKDEMKDNEAYGIVDISNISQGPRVILDTDYVNTDLNSRQNPDT